MIAHHIAPFSDKVMASPAVADSHSVLQLSSRLHQCWEKDINWTLYPDNLKDGCHQVGKAISMPPASVLAGLLMVISFCMSHYVVEVENTDWVEPVLLWISICMPTGMGKSSLYKYLRKLVSDTQSTLHTEENWLCDDQSFEKMGDLMFNNHGKLLGLYDELPMFLSQVNIFRGRGLSDSHELAVFLQLYGAEKWVRRTDEYRSEYCNTIILIVSGDANFTMTRTGLTVGGFTQPSVARNLIEIPSNVEKGLCQRFLWLVPKPTPVLFNDLQKVNETFSTTITGLMSSLWVADVTVRKWHLYKPCEVFRAKYDEVQQQLMKISCSDDLLSGMLSKSWGQMLRVSAVLHVLFHMDTPQSIPDSISEEALKAAQDFVEVCTQHAAFLAGRGTMEDAIEALQDMEEDASKEKTCYEQLTKSNATYSLLLPGKILNLTTINSLKKFRGRGNKKGAKEAWKILDEEGLGVLVEFRARQGTDMLYQFHKNEVPDDTSEKIQFMEKLTKYKVSLQQYQSSLDLDNLSVGHASAAKDTPLKDTPLRRSPRKQVESEGHSETKAFFVMATVVTTLIHYVIISLEQSITISTVN